MNHEQQYRVVTSQSRTTNLGNAYHLIKLTYLRLAVLGTPDHAGSPGVPGTKFAWLKAMLTIPCSS